MYRYPNMGYGDYEEDVENMYDNYVPYYNMYVPPIYPPVAMYPVDPYMMYYPMSYMNRQTYAPDVPMDYNYEYRYDPDGEDDAGEDEDNKDIGDDTSNDDDISESSLQNLRMRTVDISDIRD